jgi:hypothetical protein
MANDERSQLFVSVHDKTPSVVVMRVGNPNGSPLGILRDVRFFATEHQQDNPKH